MSCVGCLRSGGRFRSPSPVEDIISLAMRDSKRGLTSEAEDEISDLLLTSMGDVVQTKTNNLSKFPCVLVKEWLVSIGFPLAHSSSKTK